MSSEDFTPAQLSFFAIYSPPLGPTDETFRDQIIFYYSRAAREARGQSKGRTVEDKDGENEKLRHVGLVQGMVGFARNFSDGEPIDSVETEKSRVLMHELEKDWWVLASIDLTRLPSSTKSQDSDYSSREVSPAPLLLQQILSAHRIFSLHHGPSLNDMYAKLPRDKFSGIVERFWNRFCRNWDVLLHGNPAVDVFGGLKLAAGGELGFGVGEEEWGSGDREVLEGLVHNTEGLVDLTVSRYGEAAPPEPDYHVEHPSQDTIDDAMHGVPWLGCRHEPQAPDGLIFGGVGAIARPSLRDMACWVRDIYAYGEQAYGVKDNPHRQRRKRRRRQPIHDPEPEPEPEPEPDPKPSPDDVNLRRKVLVGDIPLPHDPRPQMHDRVASHDHATGSSAPQVASHPGVPPPIVSAADASLEQAVSAAAKNKPNPPQQPIQESSSSTLGISDKWVKYLTFGLASAKPSPSASQRPDAPRRTSTAASPSKDDNDSKDQPPMQYLDPVPDGQEVAALMARQRQLENKGHFLIGYRGDLDRIPAGDDDTGSDTTFSSATDGERNLLRTIKVKLTNQHTSNSGSEVEDDHLTQDSRAKCSSCFQSLRVLVYVHRPFIYVFLFEQRTPSLQISAFYRELHKHLRPLHKSLLSSTSIHHVAERIAAAHTSPPQPISVNPQNPPFQPPRTSPVFDLVYDPVYLTCHTSLPNIPEHGQTLTTNGTLSTSSSGRDAPPTWTRLEALNVHSHILHTLAITTRIPNDTERTSKTSRHWWVVWLRVPQPGSANGEVPRPEHCRTAFLVRKARDHVLQPGNGSRMASRVSSGMLGYLGMGAGAEDHDNGTATGWGSAAALAGGIGIDARRYVENLLSLNR